VLAESLSWAEEDPVLAAPPDALVSNLADELQKDHMANSVGVVLHVAMLPGPALALWVSETYAPNYHPDYALVVSCVEMCICPNVAVVLVSVM